MSVCLCVCVFRVEQGSTSQYRSSKRDEYQKRKLDSVGVCEVSQIVFRSSRCEIAF